MPEITCTGCGRAMDDSLKVCPGCGKKIEAAPVADDAPASLAPDEEVPEIDLNEPAVPVIQMSDLELPAGDPTRAPTAQAVLQTAAVEAYDESAPPVDEPVREDSEEDPVPPRADTVRMSLSDATNAWVEDSMTEEPVGAVPEVSAKSRAPLLIGVLVVAAAALAILLLAL